MLNHQKQQLVLNQIAAKKKKITQQLQQKQKQNRFNRINRIRQSRQILEKQLSEMKKEPAKPLTEQERLAKRFRHLQTKFPGLTVDMMFPRNMTITMEDPLPDIKQNSKINQFCRYPFVISIRKPRFEACAKRMSELGVLRWDASNGTMLNRQNLIQNGKTVGGKTFRHDANHPYRFLKMGEYGCSLSHITLWEYAVKHNIPYLMVIEDDWGFRTTDDGIEKLNTICEELKKFPNLDVAYLFASINVRGNSTPVSDNWCRIPLSPQTTCYIITLKGMRRMLKNAYPIVKPIDMYMKDEIVSQKMKWMVSKTNIAPVMGFKSDTWNL